MEVPPTRADLRQVLRGREGQMIEVEDDVQNVVNDLAQIDHHFRVRWSDAGNYFVVYYRPDEGEDGDGYLVTTATELDQRVVKHVQKIWYRVLNDDADLGAEIDAIDDAADRAKDHAFTESAGENYERLAHAIRHDLGVKNKIFVPNV